MAPQVKHAAEAYRLNHGWRRWWAGRCPACKFEQPGGSKEGAEQLARTHNEGGGWR